MGREFQGLAVREQPRGGGGKCITGKPGSGKGGGKKRSDVLFMYLVLYVRGFLHTR